MRVFTKITRGKYSVPDVLSKLSTDLISKLLVQNVALRLGNQYDGINDLKSHKWFGSFDWLRLNRGSLTSPRKVTVNLPTTPQKDASTSIDDMEEVNWFPKLSFSDEDKVAIKLLEAFRSRKSH